MKPSTYIILLLALLPALLLASEPETEVLKKQVPFSGEKSLSVFIDFGNGYIYLDRGDSINVFAGSFRYEKYRPRVQYERIGEEGRLSVKFSGKIHKDDEEQSQNISSLDKLYNNELNLQLSPALPIDLDAKLGVVKGSLDLGGLNLNRLNLELGVSQVQIAFEQPNPNWLRSCSIQGGVGKLRIVKLGNAHFRHFSFEGGVGAYSIDLSGDIRGEATADIQMGLGKLRIYLPRDVGTRVEVEKSFLSSFSIDECYKKGKYYYNDNWSKTDNSLDVRIETGLGKIEVIWVDE